MIRLLRANFHRLLKDKMFWFALIFMAGSAVFFCVSFKISEILRDMYTSIEDVFMFTFSWGGLAVPGVVMAVVCTLFVGKEYAGGTIRNKLIIGQTRAAVWFANALTCMAIGLSIEIVSILFCLALGLPMFGEFTISAAQAARILVTGTLMMLSYATVMNAVTMLSRNQTAAVIINLLIVIVMMFLSITLTMKISEPEFWETSEGLEKNEYCPSPALKAFYQFVIDLFPTGQSSQLATAVGFTRTWQPPVYSLCLIAAVNAAGVAVFKRLDLK